VVIQPALADRRHVAGPDQILERRPVLLERGEVGRVQPYGGIDHLLGGRSVDRCARALEPDTDLEDRADTRLPGARVDVGAIGVEGVEVQVRVRVDQLGQAYSLAVCRRRFMAALQYPFA
jgi:hypothetical protein